MAWRPSGLDDVGMLPRTLPRPVVAAGTALVVVTPVVTWWAMGDRSVDLPDPDYMVRPLPLSRAEEMAIGITATLIAVAATVLLVRSQAQHPVDRRWLAVLGPLLAAGAVVGAGWRIVTAGVIGANIGGGVFMLVGPWIVLALVVGAATQYYKLWRGG